MTCSGVAVRFTNWAIFKSTPWFRVVRVFRGEIKQSGNQGQASGVDHEKHELHENGLGFLS